MEFGLTIELGNDAMQTPTDVARALEQIASKLRNWDEFAPSDGAWIMDANGNSVGKWGLK